MTKNARLLLIAFVSGALVMVFEIVGARILAPYIGTSFYVWTALIGFVLASLSLGYFVGGRLIDEKPQEILIAKALFMAAISLFGVYLFKDDFLQWINQHVIGIKASALMATFVLFVPPSFFLGNISPMVSRLILNEIQTAGKSMGGVFAYSSIGSLLGTFLAGFVLIPIFPLSTIMLGLVGIALSLSLYLFFLEKKWLWVFVGFALLCMLVYMGTTKKADSSYILETESSYNSIKIYPSNDYKTGDSILMMQLGRQRAGGMSLVGNPLPFNYLYYFRLAEHFKPGFSKALMLGGAAYSFPKYVLKNYPETHIDVVEIDEKLSQIAYDFFELPKNNARLTIFHEDARTFLNKQKDKYDVIYSDTFCSAISLPYQLTSIEAVQLQYDMLEEDGLLIVNVIQAVSGR
ncbi:MAG: hypothetical protein B7C24_00945 [Bacteroidetes bacterium 4572_77]|nr:MAG: hypothetical protein B7C24_00945 [Bacteroidetes bacterium 4572_77]